MSVLEGFELYQAGSAKPFITLRDGSVTFSKQAVECMEYAEYVHVYLDRGGRRFAVQASENDDAAFVFYQKPKDGRSMLVRLSDRRFADQIKELAGIERCEKGLRYYGSYAEDEHILIFDMSVPGIYAAKEKE